jgi:hypothetical protein
MKIRTANHNQLDYQDFQEELRTPSASILSAITLEDYADNGAPFNPFLMKFAGASDFNMIWASEHGDYPIWFYQYGGGRTDQFLPLGDYAITQDVPFGHTPIMLLGVQADYPDALAHPTDFTWILNDHGSGNAADVNYWWPVAPDGYSAVGICVSGGAKPNVNDYWCVANDYLQDAAVQNFWSDAGQHWKSWNGNLDFPMVQTSQTGGSLLLAPTTMISEQFTADNNGVTNASCLVVDKLFLPVPAEPISAPPYSDLDGVASSTPEGIAAVAVLPVNVIVDASRGAEPQSSPFYYLAGQPYWTCTNAFPSPAGGIYTKDYEVGTAESQSQSFEETNSVTVSADVGVEAGEGGGVSAHIAVSYTHEMSIGTSSSVDHDTRTTTTLALNLPISDRVLIWQKYVDFVTYRTNGTTLSRATYADPEATFRYKSTTA